MNLKVISIFADFKEIAKQLKGQNNALETQIAGLRTNVEQLENLSFFEGK